MPALAANPAPAASDNGFDDFAPAARDDNVGAFVPAPSTVDDGFGDFAPAAAVLSTGSIDDDGFGAFAAA